MTISITQLKWIALATVCAGLLLGTYVLAATPAPATPSLGDRGRRRRAALDQGGLFAAIEPMLRKVAGWVSRFGKQSSRETLELLLRRSGYVAGLTPDELLALMVLSALGLSGMVYLICFMLGEEGLLWGAVALALGAFLPYLQLQETMKQRFKRVNRGLPPAIDLVSLCMGAGSDFPSALRFVVRETVDATCPVREECIHILAQLELGHTRAHALKTFADRVPTDSVRDFVSAVIQAEEKGSPIADALAIQATMLRMRRSVAAEEAAARAGVMLIGPLMILLLAILLILFAPFIINGMGF